MVSLPYCDSPADVKVSWGRSNFAEATVLDACTPLSVRLVLRYRIGFKQTLVVREGAGGCRHGSR